MAIPTIPPYPIPTDPDLPDNRVNWQLDPVRAALMIHDMQGYFVAPFVRARSPLTELLGNTELLHKNATELDIPVIYTAQPGGMSRAERGLLDDFWGPGMGTDPRHRQIVEELAPSRHDTVLTKWRYSAFHRTELADLLRELGRDQLIISGVYAHVGCLMTACEAFTLDIQPFLVADAVADFSLDEHRMALSYAARRCAVALSARTVTRTLHENNAATLPG